MLYYQFDFVLLEFSRIYRDTEDRLITQLRNSSAMTQGKVISSGDRAQNRPQKDEGVRAVPFLKICI